MPIRAQTRRSVRGLAGQEKECYFYEKRGRWVSGGLLKRYGKESRLLKELQKVHPHILDFGQHIMSNFKDLILNRLLPPSIPESGVVSLEIAQKMQLLATAAVSRGSL